MNAHLVIRGFTDYVYAELRTGDGLGELIAQSTLYHTSYHPGRDMEAYANAHGITITHRHSVERMENFK